MRDKVGDDRRARTSLRQRVLEAGDLRDDRRDLLVKLETVVADKVPPNPAEIERRKEILQVEIEDIAAALMPPRITDDGQRSSEAV